MRWIAIADPISCAALGFARDRQSGTGREADEAAALCHALHLGLFVRNEINPE
jgi:hypothetical protein